MDQSDILIIVMLVFALVAFLSTFGIPNDNLHRDPPTRPRRRTGYRRMDQDSQ